MIGKPKIFKEAVEFILEKDFLPADQWDAEIWRGEEENVTLRAFWSSRVESGRFLDRAQGFLFDELTNATEKVTGPDGVERVALRAGGRANFVRQMREFMVSEGMVADEDEFREVNQNDIRDIRSESRLRLIYDTNIRQAYGYGQWKQGMTPAVLRRYPAQRFVRDRQVGIKRKRHEQSEGEVRLKANTKYWADYQNDPAIGGFGVPWAPFGFHSGMGVRDVSREEAFELGLLAKRDEVVNPANEGESLGLNDNLQSSVKKMSPEVKKKLIDELRSFKAKDAKKAGAEAALKVKEKNGILKPELEERISKTKKRENVDEKDIQNAIANRLDKKAAQPQTKSKLQKGIDRSRQLSGELSITPDERLMLGSPLEIMVTYSAEGRLLKVVKGKKNRVNTPLDTPDNAIVSHNHPSGTGFSPKDIEYALQHPERTLRVVTRNENNQIELFQIKSLSKLSDFKSSVIVEAYKRAFKANNHQSIRIAIDLITELFGDTLSIERKVIK